MGRLARLAALLGLIACGARHDEANAPITIPVEPVGVTDAGVRDAPPEAAFDATLAVTDDSTTMGWNGPHDAQGLIGPAGAAVVGKPETIAFVHSAAIRVDARSAALRQILLATLPGWGEFMPYDVVDPIADIDWVLMAGSLVLGQTAANVFIAHYDLTEPQADVAMATLLKTLPNALSAAAYGGAPKAFTALVDGADRLYVRPRPGVLAIVPVSEGTRIVDLLARVDVPTNPRRGELARVVDSSALRYVTIGVPQIRSARYWITATNDDVTAVRLEGDCGTPADAAAAADEMTTRIKSASGSFAVKLMAPWLEHITPHAVGAAVRASAELHDDDVNGIAKIVGCRGSAGCP